MILALRALILIGAVFGYCAFLKKYMIPAFTPIVALSSIGVLIFLAGLLNVMLLSSLVIVMGGWFCLFACKPWKKGFLKEYRDLFPAFAIFALLCMAFFFRVYKQIPTHYDCFSHWLTVAREMLKTHRMPNFTSSMISFQGYPTGSAGYIYFVCQVLGNSRDDLILFVQATLYAASLTAFSAFIKRKDITSILIAVAGGLFCLAGQARGLEHLLVDALISLLSVAVVAILIYYRRELLKGVFVSLPLQMFLVAVKNSGIIMVAFHFVLVLALAVGADYTAKRKLSFRNLVKLGGITAGVPAVLYYLWMQHVEYVFKAGALSKHTTSVDNYMQNLSNQNGEQIRNILQQFWNRFASWNPSWLFLIILSALILAGWLIKRYVLKQKSKAELFVFLGVIGAYLVFMAVLAAMYILSMPYEEAIVLAAYVRYENTVLVYILGAMTIYALHLVSLLPGWKKEGLLKVLVLLLISSTLLFHALNITVLFDRTDRYTGSHRYNLETIKNRYEIEEGKSYFIYGKNVADASGYYHYLTRYLFWSQQIRLCSPERFETMKTDIENCDYLIVVDQDDTIREFLAEHNLDLDQQAYAVKEVWK